MMGKEMGCSVYVGYAGLMKLTDFWVMSLNGMLHRGW